MSTPNPSLGNLEKVELESIWPDEAQKGYGNRC